MLPFFKIVSLRLPYLPLCLKSSLTLCIIWQEKTPLKLSKTPGKVLEKSWNLSGKNEWPPYPYLGIAAGRPMFIKKS